MRRRVASIYPYPGKSSSAAIADTGIGITRRSFDAASAEVSMFGQKPTPPASVDVEKMALCWLAYREFNAIRARSGAPDGVSHVYWYNLTEAFAEVRGRSNLTPWPPTKEIAEWIDAHVNNKPLPDYV